ncbi:Hypothetical predicted protein [Olea europaea subsp. europaea]|uniref:Uncharacterized protein n=1 Tax=Olea europaea subsp. europaea TaxID=158383 RepID=A0A8S0UG25_OLEEU|nr:Hypothetical predicted protein [Olea europaea subsp. europaea]
MPPVGTHQFLFPNSSQILEYQLSVKEAGFEFPPLGEYVVGMFSCPLPIVEGNKEKSYSQSRKTKMPAIMGLLADPKKWWEKETVLDSIPVSPAGKSKKISIERRHTCNGS